MLDNSQPLAYSSRTAPHCAVGIDVLIGAAKVACDCIATFLSSVLASLWQVGRGSRKARWCSTSTSTPFRPAALIDVGLSGFNLKLEQHIMTTLHRAPTRTTTATPFFSINSAGDKLFSINPNIDLLDALEQASVFLEAALHDAINASALADHQLHSVSFLIELTKSIVDSAAQTLINERSAA